MQPEFWHQRWQEGEIAWHLNEINLHLQEHWHGLGATPGGRVLVPLCGKTLDLVWLAAQGHRVLGVELSSIAVEALFHENGLTPTITDEPPFRRYRVDELEVLCGDFFDLDPSHLGEVDAVYDRASLIALPPDLRSRYAERLRALIQARTKVLLITLEYDQAEMDGPPFSVQEPEIQTLFLNHFDIRSLAAVDALPESPGLRKRGLTHLTERVCASRPLD